MQKIIVPGHTVVRMNDGSFEPSGLYQEIYYPEPGKQFPFRRTGVWHERYDPNSQHTYLGGGRIVCEAANNLWYELGCNDSTEIVMVGGRSDYLAAVASDQPDLDEATVMRDHVRQRSGGKVPVRAIGWTRTTEHDMAEVFNQAELCDRVYVVMMGFRIPRAETIAQKAIVDQPHLDELSRRVSFVPAERYYRFAEGEYEQMLSSAAYAFTMHNERFGIRKMLQGLVATTGGKT